MRVEYALVSWEAGLRAMLKVRINVPLKSLRG